MGRLKLSPKTEHNSHAGNIHFKCVENVETLYLDLLSSGSKHSINTYFEELNRVISRSHVLDGSETDVIRDNLSRQVTSCVGTAG
jgi:hypothetical protein